MSFQFGRRFIPRSNGESKSKYGSHKIILPDGTKFDSKLEYNRWNFLCMLEKNGTITNLRRQVPYVLIPSQKQEIKQVGKRGQPIKSKVKTIELECAYKADFVYIIPSCASDGDIEVVEDTKGFKTPDYIIKRKLMLYVHHLQIREVKKYNQSVTQ